MMKKARKVAMESSPSSSLLPIGEEARARFKHQVLFQDYEEVRREMESKKRKLQKTIEKKLKLDAEVKFLRRKYKSFSRNPTQGIPCRLKKQSQRKPCRLKKQSHRIPSPSVGLAQPQNPVNHSDLSLQDKNPRAKEAPSTSALFDLNQISLPSAEEMEEIQVEWEPLKVDKSKRCSADGNMVANDLNVSILRDVGKGSGLVGKRKISWQDQVALRV